MKPTISLKNKALAFLSRREHTFSELFAKLQKYTDNLEEIRQLLNDLKQRGWLSEERYVNGYINSKKNKYGRLKIRYNLLQKQVDPDLVEQTLKDNDINEYQVALEVWTKKFGTVSKNPKEIMRQIRFLQGRGFSYDVIKKIVA